MADSWTQSVVCRYFKNGMCREGNSCRYRHTQGPRNDRINEVQMPRFAATSDVVCRYFKRGICNYGFHCYFRHDSDTADNYLVNANLVESTQPGQYTSNTSTSTTIKNVREGVHIGEESVKAPEFLPSDVAGSSTANEAVTALGTSTSSPTPISYAHVLNPPNPASSPSLEPLCPYAETTGICKKRNCTYLHGAICDLCNRAALHPHNEELQKKHINACVKQHEIDMELSFAVQRSREKSCGICFEIIMEKASGEQRFGILPNCNHCFCLSCIRKWRQAKQFENKIIKACPECRVNSNFVCPSVYWVDAKEDKEKLITDYKRALSTKDCKHFNKGLGKCPFGNKCFYLHALPDGTKRDVGPPVRKGRISEVNTAFVRQLILWDVLDERDYHWIHDENLDDIVSFSDSETEAEYYGLLH